MEKNFQIVAFMVVQEDFVLRSVQIPNGSSGTQKVDVVIESGVITFVGERFSSEASHLKEIHCNNEKLLIPG